MVKRTTSFRPAGFLATGLILVLLIVIGTIRWFPDEPESETTPSAEASDEGIAKGTAKPSDALGAAVLPAGDSRWGQVVFDGETHALVANARGEFPRFHVDPGTQVQASASFPNALPDARVAADADDGGYLPGIVGGHLRLDDSRRATFDFELPHHDGAHRVTLRYGDDLRTFEFWVGDEPPVVVRRDES